MTLPDASDPRMECCRHNCKNLTTYTNYNYVWHHTFITLYIQPMYTMHAHTKALNTWKCFQTLPLQDLVVIKPANQNCPFRWLYNSACDWPQWEPVKSILIPPSAAYQQFKDFPELTPFLVDITLITTIRFTIYCFGQLLWRPKMYTLKHAAQHFHAHMSITTFKICSPGSTKSNPGKRTEK
jgi:hypothetical protein